MFSRNFLENGEYVSVVPVGILVTIQYDPNGRIERIIKGTDESGQDLGNEFLKPIVDNGLVPTLLLARGGRTWINGVLYTRVYSYLTENGVLPESIYEKLKKDFLKNPKSFTFVSYCAKSLAVMFRGSLAVRQWLTASGFNTVPGMPLSQDVLIESNFVNRLEKYLGDMNCFDFPLISGYCVFHNGQPNYYPNEMRIEVVKKTEMTTDAHGNMYMEINGDLTVDYNDAINLYDVKKGVSLLVDHDNEVVHSYKNGLSTVEIRHNPIKCPVCGNVFYLPTGSMTKCSDLHCNSRLFIATNQLLSAYGLPNVTYAAYLETTKEIGNSYSVPDILKRMEYNFGITINLPTLLYGIIPRNIVADYQSLVILCNRCHNSIDNVLYKFSNLGILEKDEDIPEVYRLVAWLKDPRNLNDIQKLVENPNITIGNNIQKFDVDPLFRNLKICITGDFTHGSDLDIKNIFTSYAGEIVDVNKSNVVVVGGTQTNIDGQIIKTARDRGITIIDEYSFFDRYRIDDDLLRTQI